MMLSMGMFGFWVGLLLYVTVNNYGHVGTVDPPNLTSYLGKLEQAINLYVVHIYSNKKEKSDFMVLYLLIQI